MDKLSEKIVELRLATRRLCMCEGIDNNSTMTIKTKALFLIRNNATPNELISALNIAKTNLSILARDMIRDGLISKSVNPHDERQISYSITPLGLQVLNNKLQTIEQRILKTVADDKEYNEQLNKINEVLNFFSFI